MCLVGPKGIIFDPSESLCVPVLGVLKTMVAIVLSKCTPSVLSGGPRVDAFQRGPSAVQQHELFWVERGLNTVQERSKSGPALGLVRSSCGHGIGQRAGAVRSKSCPKKWCV